MVKTCEERGFCFREINPHYQPGIFFGQRRVKEENYYGCYLCDLVLKNGGEGHEVQGDVNR